MIEEQKAKRDNEGKVDSLKEEVAKLKKSRDKLKNKEKADSTRHSALKMKCEHIAAEAQELRCELDSVQKKYNKVKELETDIRIVDRVRTLRQCTTEDSTWIQVSLFRSWQTFCLGENFYNATKLATILPIWKLATMPIWRSGQPITNCQFNPLRIGWQLGHPYPIFNPVIYVLLQIEDIDPVKGPPSSLVVPSAPRY